MSDLISKLSELRSQYNCFNEHERDAYHILSEAIKVLSERPEPCEDAVSREAVLDKAYAYGNGLEPEGYCVNVEDIQALPPVTPERKTGKWIYPYGTTRLVAICSECGSHGSGKFCSNCGSYNKGE